MASVRTRKRAQKSVKIEYEVASIKTSITEVSKDESAAKKLEWEPPNWRAVYENIREMRKNLDAPVDDMGCERCGDETAEAKVYRFHTLVALMLSSQTKDQVTHAAMQRLKEKKLSVDMILDTSESEIQTLIYPVGFYKRKAGYLKQAAGILKEKYDSDIPSTVKDLCSLPGVGPKMAHLCMQCAWDKNSGIGVDTHVHRIANRLGWLKKATKNPEDTRKGLEDWLPSDLWREVNWMLVGFGQTICTPLRPKCESCLNQALCPVGKTSMRVGNVKGKGKKKDVE